MRRKYSLDRIHAAVLPLVENLPNPARCLRPECTAAPELLASGSSEYFTEYKICRKVDAARVS